MNTSTFEGQLTAELQKFGCEYHITAADVMHEFSELDVKEQAARLDPEDLALVILDRLNEAGFMELTHTAVRTAVTDMLVNHFNVECDAAFAAIAREAPHG